jgi:hypothetical protein
VLVGGAVWGVLGRLRAFEREKDAVVLKAKQDADKLIREAVGRAEELAKELRADYDERLDDLGKLIDKHDHTLYGEDGDNGHKATLRDLLDWRYGRGDYGPKDLETRCRHDAQNEIQKTMDKMADEMKLERRRLPKRGA